MKIDFEPLLAAASEARSHAHAPYSRYRVGAAILTRAGRVYAGCNVENASYGAALCAERAAIAAMVAAGDRDPVACVVLTSAGAGGRASAGAGARSHRRATPASPCGICRQVLSEFASEMKLLLASEDARGTIVARKTTHLTTLLPQAFGAFRLESISPIRAKNARG
jgi:cytidine deaminase